MMAGPSDPIRDDAAGGSHRLTRFWRRRDWKVQLSFVVVASVLLGAVLLIYRTVEAERDLRAQVTRTSDVLLELRNLNRAVLSAETGQRGYFITLDRRYLLPYRIGASQYVEALQRLRAAARSMDEAEQRHLLDRIGTLTAVKFGEMADSVGMVQSGRVEDARDGILSDEGQETMTRLENAIRRMEELEGAALRRTAARAAAVEGSILPMLGGLFVALVIALMLGYAQARRVATAEAQAANAAALTEAHDRADLLARELNHRVKNLFAVILAIVRMSARDAPQAKPVTEKIAERINALMTAHNVTQGTGESQTADLRALIQTTLAPYQDARTQSTLAGPDVALGARQVTPLGLVLHELTTNAVKYGAWSQGGALDVSWQVDTDGEGCELRIDWREHCPQACAAPARQGFGSMLMTSAARQLQGTITREFTAAGLEVAFRIPLATATLEAGEGVP